MGRSYTFESRAVRVAVFATVISLIVLLDQATKLVIRRDVPLDALPIPFIPGILEIDHVRNSGAAFGFAQGGAVFFIILALAVLVGTFLWIWYEKLPLYLVISLASIAGGGVGNMVDRIACGQVTDFIAFAFMDFPVFNVADIFVSCGVAVTFIAYIFWDKVREPLASPAVDKENA